MCTCMLFPLFYLMLLLHSDTIGQLIFEDKNFEDYQKFTLNMNISENEQVVSNRTTILRINILEVL